MAKKKDITRNPPSWLEKGLFITVILIIIAIAFPIFWRLNESTRQFYECVNLQNELQPHCSRFFAGFPPLISGNVCIFRRGCDTIRVEESERTLS